jgi:hypothetical protein
MTWTFLSKNNQDEYMEMFARGSGSVPTLLETWKYKSDQNTIVVRGIMKHKIIKQCWQDQRPYLYMDSGYVGNRTSIDNPNGWKYYHRIVLNDLQHDKIISRPADRWERLGIKIQSWRRTGSKILIAAPDAKPCIFYGVDLEQWIAETVATIKLHTDRPVEIRQRNPDRRARVKNNLESALDDVHAVVTFNSIAATESILAGVPAFVLAPCNAARPVANIDLTQIDTPTYADQDRVHAWAHHLAYGQFHNDELKNGVATRILKETYNV